jgi:hypothetical protein
MFPAGVPGPTERATRHHLEEDSAVYVTAPGPRVRQPALCEHCDLYFYPWLYSTSGCSDAQESRTFLSLASQPGLRDGSGGVSWCCARYSVAVCPAGCILGGWVRYGHRARVEDTRRMHTGPAGGRRVQRLDSKGRRTGHSARCEGGRTGGGCDTGQSRQPIREGPASELRSGLRRDVQPGR